MNWFELDDGLWCNLDHVTVLRAPNENGVSEIEFIDKDTVSLTAGEVRRLTLQLRNSQRPRDRTVEPPEGVKPKES
jgi:hypothetical protein